MGSTVSTLFVTILSVAVMVLKNNNAIKQVLAGKLQNSLSKLNRHIPISTGFQLSQSPHFSNAIGLVDVYNSLLQLQEYGARAYQQNAILYHRARALEPTQIEQLRTLNYYEKLEQVNESISVNVKTTQLIVENALTKLLRNNSLDSRDGKELISICKGLGYECKQDGVLKRIPVHKITLSPKSNQGRVSEAISHMCRDWHQSFQNERRPLTEFMISRVRELKLKGKTLLVVPGSGAGGLAYEIATAFASHEVHSIELSTLMYLCNDFALDYEGSATIKPFTQHFSGQLSTELQTRPFNINFNKVHRPANLKIHLGNFCEFKPQDDYDQIIVLSAYFIDTAENLFDYFDAIEGLKSSCSKLHWLNVGPLKYGTQPKVQLTDEELSKLREARKWKDLYHSCNPKELCGYLTNEKSLYQGYYGLVKFHSVYTGN
ncbi:LANO_0H16842g1_1 [Lachancea nothofagi CBS 11611]|uniref:LANO_0H16842g1_1 n=1 Tax=Lachancea nothofagi CBS 11611 TaxID=1266666 RepID=A0A1G4KMX4_9SACH|nr:LANO_0H16842g1_1 [Lachancea nothofagi CBS 11611]